MGQPCFFFLKPQYIVYVSFGLELTTTAMIVDCRKAEKLSVIAPSEARGVGIGRNLMKFAIVTQWVRVECGSSPT